VDLVERVGSYVGLAAFLGLAVLALLYFSQARDVRRLRDWAGRAPERALGQEERATEVAPATPAAQHSLPATPFSEATAPRKRKPLRERIRNVHIPHARYIAMSVAGLLIAAGAAYAVIGLTDDDATTTSTGNAEQRGGGGGDNRSEPKRRVNVDPAEVTVAVLNGTPVQGLAAQVGQEVSAGGFVQGTIGNAARIDQAESEVLYRNGQERAARAVANRLGIDETGLVDSVNEEIAGSFDVVVLVGSDRQ
jgi:hypothetical protein